MPPILEVLAYLMTFMESYQLKAERATALRSKRRRSYKQILGSEGLGLPWHRVELYDDVNPANPRAANAVYGPDRERSLAAAVDPARIALLRASGVYADPVLRGLTKRLVFGSWTVVPKTLTCLLSYEAERRMIRTLETSPVNTTCAAGSAPSAYFHLLAGTPYRNARVGHVVSSHALARFASPRNLAS